MNNCEAASLELHKVDDGLEVSGVPQERSTSCHQEQEHRSPCTVYKVADVVVLSAIVLGLLALYMIPTIYFIIPPLELKPVRKMECMLQRGARALAVNFCSRILFPSTFSHAPSHPIQKKLVHCPLFAPPPKQPTHDSRHGLEYATRS